MLLYFIRHGQTDDNISGVIQGQKDTPLNDHGRLEAELVSARLAHRSFSEIWSSSLSRASETAEIIARPHRMSVQTHRGLMERGLGSLEGHRRKPGEPLPPDIEAGDKFSKRIMDWFVEFLATHRSDNGPICIVSHGAYLTTLVSLLVSPKHFAFERGAKVNLRNGCFNTMIMKVSCEYAAATGKWAGRVESWGDIEHLKGIGRIESSSKVADDVKA